MSFNSILESDKRWGGYDMVQERVPDGWTGNHEWSFTKLAWSWDDKLIMARVAEREMMKLFTSWTAVVFGIDRLMTCTNWRDGWHGLHCSLMHQSSTQVLHILTLLAWCHHQRDGKRCCQHVEDDEQWCITGTLTLLGWSLNAGKPSIQLFLDTCNDSRLPAVYSCVLSA